MKNIKEKEPIVNETINQDSTRIDKLEGIITNLGTTFSSVKNTPSPPTKITKLMYVPKKIRVNPLARKLRISNL